MNKGSNRTFSLGELWRECLSVLYPGEFQKPIIGKEWGQLKNLADIAGLETRAVVIYALSNWHEFGHKAKSSAGLDNYPTRPHIGFLLAHCDVAVNLMRQSIAKQKSLLAPAISITAEITNNVVLPEPSPEGVPYKPTKADIAEFYAALAEKKKGQVL